MLTDISTEEKRIEKCDNCEMLLGYGKLQQCTGLISCYISGTLPKTVVSKHHSFANDCVLLLFPLYTASQMFFLNQGCTFDIFQANFSHAFGGMVQSRLNNYCIIP